MKKFALVSLFSASLLLLVPLVIFADDVDNISTDQQGTEKVVIFAIEDPIEPVNPEEPTDPVEPVNPEESTNPEEPIDPEEPTDSVEPTEPTTPAVPNEPVDNNTRNKPNTPSLSNGSNAAENTSPREESVQTEGGKTVVGADNSNPNIQMADGSTKKVTAEEIGDQVQSDGTIHVKESDGKMKVLPKTGEKEQSILSVIGSLIVLGTGIIWKRRV